MADNKRVEIPKESLLNWASGNYKTEVPGKSGNNMPKQTAPGMECK
jgi:hypothetical protein